MIGDKHCTRCGPVLLLLFILPMIGTGCDHSGQRTPSSTGNHQPSSKEQAIAFSGEHAASGKLVNVAGYPNTQKLRTGETFELMFVFSMKPDWHIYWKNSGETGAATEIQVESSKSFDVGEIRWPRPIRFSTSGLKSYGYQDQVVLFVPVTVNESPGSSPRKFSAEIYYVACRKKCIQGEASVKITIPGTTVPEGKYVKRLIREHRKAIPKSLEQISGVDLRYRDGDVLITGPSDRIDRATVRFFPDSVSGVESGSLSKENLSETDKVRYRIPVSTNPRNHLGDGMALRGLLVMGNDRFSPAYQIDVPLPGETEQNKQN